MESQIAPIIISFVLGIFASLAATVLWDFLVGKISFRSSDYPDLRGRWVAEVDLQDDGVEPFEEFIEVKKQFFRRTTGSYLSPSLAQEDQKFLELEFEGYLLDHTTLKYECKSTGGETVDYVIGMARIANNRKEGVGASVSMGMLRNEN